MNSLVDILVSAGALEPLGPSDQEKQEIQQICMEANRRRCARVQAIKSAAKKNGEDPPPFNRGRPKKHHTSEERKLAQRDYNQRSKARTKEMTKLVCQGLERFASTAQLVPRSPAPTNDDLI